MEKSQVAVSALHPRTQRHKLLQAPQSFTSKCVSQLGMGPNARASVQAAAPARQLLLRHSGTFERADSWRLRSAARPSPGKHLSSCRDTDMRHKACQISFTPTSQPSSTNPSFFAPPLHPPRVLLHRFLWCVDVVWVAYDVCLCVCVWHLANANRKRSSSPGLTILTQILRSTGHTAGGRAYAKNNDSAEQVGRGGHMYRCLLCRSPNDALDPDWRPWKCFMWTAVKQTCSYLLGLFAWRTSLFSVKPFARPTHEGSLLWKRLVDVDYSEHEHCWTHGSRMNANFQVKNMNRRITLRRIGEEPQWHSLLGFRYLQSHWSPSAQALGLCDLLRPADDDALCCSLSGIKWNSFHLDATVSLPSGFLVGPWMQSVIRSQAWVFLARDIGLRLFLSRDQWWAFSDVALQPARTLDSLLGLVSMTRHWLSSLRPSSGGLSLPSYE